MAKQALREMMVQLNAQKTLDFLQKVAYPLPGSREEEEVEEEERAKAAAAAAAAAAQQLAEEEAENSNKGGKKGGKAALKAKNVGKGASKEEEVGEEEAARKAAMEAQRRALLWDPAKHRFAADDVVRIAEWFHDEFVAFFSFTLCPPCTGTAKMRK